MNSLESRHRFIITTVMFSALILVGYAWLAKPSKFSLPEPIASKNLAPTRPENLYYEPASTKAWLGIAGVTLKPPQARAMNLPSHQAGLLIQFIEANSPAARAELEGCDKVTVIDGRTWLVGGDVIIAVDEQSISSATDLDQFLDDAKPDQQITLTILRNGVQLKLTATLAKAPVPELAAPKTGVQIT